MKHKLEICTGNLDFHTDRAIAELQNEHPALIVKQWGCLGNCHRCFHVPFCLLDDFELVESETIEQLVSKLREKLNTSSHC
ncbi:DUF1450 domain-containing protein [Sulfoacidibacillus thermotolerans]|uniref:DUF1450 domain-containing protein n=1 Tax=Sulfoacidibacillus thermotolerans TaxID=1765684 RepID=UPI0015E7FB8E